MKEETGFTDQQLAEKYVTVCLYTYFLCGCVCVCVCVMLFVVVVVFGEGGLVIIFIRFGEKGSGKELWKMFEVVFSHDEETVSSIWELSGNKC